MKKIFAVCFILLSGSPFMLFSQEYRGLEECLRLTLENNYQIKMARTDREIAGNNVTISQYLPEISISGRQNESFMDIETEAAGISTATNNNRTATYNAGASLNWRLFDGFSMFNEHYRQKEQLAISNQQLKMTIENLISSLCTEYYNILVQQKRLEAAQYSLLLSEERYDQAQEMYDIGSASGLELRQAKIDLNADSSKLVRQEETVRNAYVRLNTLMNIQLNQQNFVKDTIVLAPKMNYDDIHNLVLAQNNILLIARYGIQISEYDLRLARAALFPTLDFNTGYNYNLTTATKTNPAYNRNNGFNWGLSLSWPVFSGLETSRKIKNAQLQLKNQNYSYQQLENELLGDMTLLYNTYENNILLIAFEQESASVAQTSLDIAMARYRLGSLSGLEFRDYQKNYLDAVDRQWNALYLAKISEINLRLMAGELYYEEDNAQL
jgi:outer membrane protein TolC